MDAPAEPLVCVHGLDSSRHAWRHFVKFFSGRRRVISIDLPGFGDSDKPLDGPYTVEGMVHTLKAFVDALELEQAVFVGHSIGGAICDLFARQYPGRTAGLVMLAPYLLSRLGKGDVNPKVSKNIMLFSYFDKSNMDMNQAVQQKSVYKTPELQALRRRIADALLNVAPTSIPDFPEVVPSMIIWGKEDMVLPVSLAEHCSREHSGGSLLIVERAGHAAIEEAPDIITLEIQNFLDALDPNLGAKNTCGA